MRRLTNDSSSSRHEAQLTKTHFGTFIQDEGTHDSAIDAKAALDLVRLKVKARGGDVRSVV